MLLFSFSVILFYLFCDTSPSKHKTIVAYQSSNRRLVVEIGQWATIKPNPRDNRLCHFALAKYLKMRHMLCWNALFATLLERFFSSLFQKIALCSFKSFDELDHVVDISCFLQKPLDALCYSRKLSFYDSTLMYLAPWFFWLLRLSNPFHFIASFEEHGVRPCQCYRSN